jgi:hypothetical protein
MSTQKFLGALALSTALSACLFDDHVHTDEDHLEPYGLSALMTQDTLRWNNADAALGKVAYADTLMLKVGDSLRLPIQLMTEEGLSAPDTSDTDHALFLKSTPNASVAKMEVQGWNLVVRGLAAGQSRFRLGVLHDGHEDFVLADSVVVIVQ